MSAVWPDSFVEEGSLAQTVFMLRRKLGRAPNGEEYIQTVPRRGYRIAVPVEKVDAAIYDAKQSSPEGAQPLGNPRSSRATRFAWTLAASALSITALGIAVFMPRSPAVATYTEITNDGGDKRGANQAHGGPPAPIATDGARIYFTEGGYDARRLMQASVNGGEATADLCLPSETTSSACPANPQMLSSVCWPLTSTWRGHSCLQRRDSGLLISWNEDELAYQPKPNKHLATDEHG
jgi:hypothetical protein